RRRHTRSDRDWSSDVCSSDLNTAHSECGASGNETLARNKLLIRMMKMFVNVGDSVVDGVELAGQALYFGFGAAIDVVVEFAAKEIGRASCRERVSMLVVVVLV